MKKEELFKILCLYSKEIEKIEKDSIISNLCNVCKKRISEEDFDVAYSYWYALMIPKHKNCSTKNDIIECQKIDADCNDCKYFKRGNLESKGIFNGECLKFNKPVKAYPKFCSNHKCFIHRS